MSDNLPSPEQVELKPCPFCGGEVERQDGLCAGDANYIVHKPKAGGSGCGLSFSNFNVDGDVTELWNARFYVNTQSKEVGDDGAASEAEEIARIAEAFPPMPRCGSTTEEALARYEKAMRDEVIPAIEADRREQARLAHYARIGVKPPAINTQKVGDDVVERAAMAICAVRLGPLEKGTWAALSDGSKERIRAEARAALSSTPQEVSNDE